MMIAKNPPTKKNLDTCFTLDVAPSFDADGWGPDGAIERIVVKDFLQPLWGLPDGSHLKMEVDDLYKLADACPPRLNVFNPSPRSCILFRNKKLRSFAQEAAARFGRNGLKSLTVVLGEDVSSIYHATPLWL